MSIIGIDRRQGVDRHSCNSDRPDTSPDRQDPEKLRLIDVTTRSNVNKETMRVRELIEQLEAFPDDLNVTIVESADYIENHLGLEGLPGGAVIRANDGLILEKQAVLHPGKSKHYWYYPGWESGLDAQQIDLPAEVLWTPKGIEADADVLGKY